MQKFCICILTLISAEMEPFNYTYSSLDDKDGIRLMILMPGHKDKPLKCTITHSSLSNKPVYEALSYVWGAQDTTHTLHCNESVILVGENLFTALLQFRQHDKPRVLWVDKICIDQDNLEERGSQVSFMDRIFKAASKVIVWLGEADDETPKAYDLLDQVHDKTQENSGSFQQTLMGGRPLKKAFNLPDAESLEWKALASLLERPWFRRAWTFQEAVSAEHLDVVCGAWSNTWHRFSGSLKLIGHIQENYSRRQRRPFFDIHPDIPVQILATRSWLSGSTVEESLDLLQLLEMRRSALCADPRDRIYALLSISPEKINFPKRFDAVFPSPEYSVFDSEYRAMFQSNYSLSVRQVFTMAARQAIITSDKLYVLHDVEAPKHDKEMPSWVPDWRSNLVDSFRKPTSTGQMRPYFATGRSKTVIYYQTQISEESDKHTYSFTNPEHLILKGLYQDRISSISTTVGASNTEDIAQVVSNSAEWRKMAKSAANKLNIYMPTYEDINLAFTRARIGDIWPGQDRYKTGEKTTTKMPAHDDFHHRQRPGNQNNKAFTKGLNHCASRRFFTTEKGYMGFGPSTVREGDALYLLLGGDVPFVLREVEKSTPTQRLISQQDQEELRGDNTVKVSFVGEAYVHGLMDGEGVIRARPKCSSKRNDGGYSNSQWLVSLCLQRVPELNGLVWVTLV